MGTSVSVLLGDHADSVLKQWIIDRGERVPHIPAQSAYQFIRGWLCTLSYIDTHVYTYTMYIVTTCICLHKNLLIGIFLKRIEIKCVLDGQAITLYSFFFIRKTLLKYIAKYWNLKATIYGFVFIKWLT